MLSLQLRLSRRGIARSRDKPGIASLVAGLLDEGAGELDAARVSRAPGGTRHRASPSAPTATTCAARSATLTENRDKAFELLRLALTAPRFDGQELDRVRAAVLAQLRRRSTNPSDIAADHWFARAFPAIPTGVRSRARSNRSRRSRRTIFANVCPPDAGALQSQDCRCRRDRRGGDRDTRRSHFWRPAGEGRPRAGAGRGAARARHQRDDRAQRSRKPSSPSAASD